MPETIAQLLAAEANDFSFEAIPPEVVHQAEHLMLNALGSGLMGHQIEPGQITDSLARQMMGSDESTVFGSGFKTSCLFAALANVTKVASTGHWDKCYVSPDARVALGPNRQMIPALISVAERQGASGKDLLTAIVTAYEMSNRLLSALGGNRGLSEQGWAPDAMGRPIALALGSGRLFGFNDEQAANAVGIAGCFGIEPKVVTSPTTKFHLRSPMPAMTGLLATFLAWQGYPGPLDVFEGTHGLVNVAMHGVIDIDKLTRPRSDWTIMYTGINRTSVDGDIVGLAEATLTLTKEHDIKPEDVEKIVVRVNAFEAKNQGDPANADLKFPASREVAVHSIFYSTAIAVVDRALGFDQFLDERFLALDSRIQDIMARTVVEANPKYDGLNQSGSSEITTKSGQKFTCEVLYPKGLHPKNQMNDAEHQENFRGMAGYAIDEPQMSRLIETVYNLEKLDSVSELLNLMVVPTGS